MPYDFDTIIERQATNSLKWDDSPGELPMWVADMDFATAPAITQAVLAKAASGVFGYGIVPDAFRQAVSGWWARRHGWKIDPEWVRFCFGIVPAITSLIRTFTEPGEGVLVQSPTYNCFYDAISNLGRKLLVNDLRYVHGEFSIDWTDLEAKLADTRTKVFLLCNPQNPTGQIWSAAELARIGDLAAAHGVVMIADEIHCDLTEPGIGYIPFASVDSAAAATAITLVAPTKTFNMPGLQSAAVIVSDPDLRRTVAAGLSRDEITLPNSFAVEAAIAAYSQGADWLDELRRYIWKNKSYLSLWLAEYVPELHDIPGQATYLSWIDCTELVSDTTEFCDFLRRTTGLRINSGSIYGANTPGFIRMNLACPLSRVQDGLERLTRGVAAWKLR